MQEFYYTGQVMWSQVDANNHLRHSAYADFAAQARVDFLEKIGFSAQLFQSLHLGPILLREELVYLREVNLSEKVKVTCEILSCKPDASRWQIKHEVFRNDGLKAAEITVEGAWIDTNIRKLTALQGKTLENFMKAPKSENFKMQ